MEFQTPQKSINRSFLKTPVTQAQIDLFKKNFATMTAQAKTGESEENYKNIISAFLKNTWYGDCYINTKDRIDLAIFNGQTADSGKPAVLIEVKAPQNKGEMVSVNNFNAKAFHETVLYFMDEREKNANNEMRYVILTNYDEWFLIDAKNFLDCVAGDRRVRDIYKKFTAGQLTDTRTETFYEEVKRLNLHEHEKLTATYFTLDDIAEAFENYATCHAELGSASVSAPTEKETPKQVRGDGRAVRGDTRSANSAQFLIAIYKLLSPETLLSRPFANDSNSLDTGFYSELLHIIGLEETSEGGKKLIGRVEKNKRQDASLFESAMYQLEEKISGEEKREEVAMRLVITWVNRLLFLKLLEAQQLAYQNGDKAYRFLDSGFLKDFDELNELFFKVLARRTGDRHSSIAEKYSKIPYLNSSLFEMTEDESDFIRISELKALELAVYGSTVLKTHDGRKLTGKLDTLKYIFQFLDAYNFASEGNAEIQADTKTLINASVLGLIFEKINGYKDGSFFTPGFITQYMAHEAVSRAVVQKFNEVKNWRCQTLTDVANEIDDRKEASGIIDTIRICDPAVGSGHFLVSCLNELVAIKAQLGLLFAPDGSRIKPSDWQISVENDELSVTDEDGALYAYNPKNAANRRVQEALFAEKKTIIENCLFGVDINPNSVNICRLRLWIELLKNACYTEASGYTELETLPNIDINIKCGNSLVSRYEVIGSRYEVVGSREGAAETSTEKRKLIAEYKNAVARYKRESHKENKKTVVQAIAKIKNAIVEIGQLDLFDTEHNKHLEEGGVFKNSLEWAIEFPEVMDADGNFMGFDVVIGNPPYIESRNANFDEKVKDILQVQIMKNHQGEDTQCFPRGSDLLIFFYELSFRLIKQSGINIFITENAWLSTDYGKRFQDYLIRNIDVCGIIDTDFKSFDTADINTVITIFKRKITNSKSKVRFFHCHGMLTKNSCNTTDLSKIEKSTEFNVYDSDDILLKKYKWGFLFNTDKKLIDLLGKMVVLNNQTIAQKIEIGQGLNLTKSCILTEKTDNAVPYFISEMGATYRWDCEKFWVDKSKLSSGRRMPMLILPRGLGTHFCCMNEVNGYSASYVEIYESSKLEETEKLRLWIFCNSTLCWLLREYSGRCNLGGGMLKAEATDLKSLPLCFDFPDVEEMKNIFELAKNQKNPTKIEECMNSEIHKRIDKIVFDYFDMPTENNFATQMFVERFNWRNKKSKTKV